MRKTVLTVIAIVIVAAIAGAVLVRVLSPGPLAFAGGTPIALSDYHATDPTGVPAR